MSRLILCHNRGGPSPLNDDVNDDVLVKVKIRPGQPKNPRTLNLAPHDRLPGAYKTNEFCVQVQAFPGL